MESIIGWISVCVGAAAAVLGGASACRGEFPERGRRGEWVAAGAVVVLTAVLFLLTRLSTPPVFSLGGRLGIGILIGGLLGTMAGLWSCRMRPASEWAAAMGAVGIAGLSLLGGGLVLLLYGGYPTPALAGFMIGAMIAGVVFRLAPGRSAAVSVWVISALALAGTIQLGIYRHPVPWERVWWAAPAITAAAVLAAIVLVSGIAKLWLRMITGGALVLALAAIFAWKLLPEWPYFYAAAAGVVTFLLVAWLGSLSDKTGRAAAVSAILISAFAAIGFKLLAGFGIGTGLLYAVVILIPAAAFVLRQQEDDESEGSALFGWLIGAFYVGIAMVMLRLFLENYSSSLSGVDIRAHYTFVALIIGAVFPFLIAAAISSAERKRTLFVLCCSAALGLAAAAVPIIALAVWGFKALLGFMIGTIAGQVFVMMGGSALYGKAKDAALILTAAAQVSAVTLGGLAAPLNEATRVQKVWMLAAVLVVIVIWTALAWLVNRDKAVERG